MIERESPRIALIAYEYVERGERDARLPVHLANDRTCKRRDSCEAAAREEVGHLDVRIETGLREPICLEQNALGQNHFGFVLFMAADVSRLEHRQIDVRQRWLRLELQLRCDLRALPVNPAWF